MAAPSTCGLSSDIVGGHHWSSHVEPSECSAGHDSESLSCLFNSTIILDVPSTVVSRAPSPERSTAPIAINGVKEDANGIKRVLKEVKAPPPEFDMSSFGF